MKDRKPSAPAIQPRVPSVVSATQDVTRGLRALADPVRARGVQMYFKEEITSLGIAAPVLREFMRERTRVLRGTWDVSQAVEFCDRMLREREMDLRGAGILLLSAFHRQLTPAVLHDAERWLSTRLDNWALVDSFCGGVLSPLLKIHPEAVEKALRAWSKANILWLRRASLVALVPSARHGGHLDLSYELARDHFRDPEDLMHKATGWLLREAGRTDRPRLKQFLLRHGPAIPRTALRYAIEHFPLPERKSLLTATRRAADA